MATNYQIGDRIQNRWEIHKILGGPGSSGMGIVYVVYDHKFREAFAAKTFQDEVFSGNPQIADRFTQEALAWVNLDVHQNVTLARFVEKIEGKPYLFLEYVSGGDMGGWIGTPRLTEDLPQVLRFAIQFCDGMSHALSKGIKAHRDIKPQNCLITEDRTLKVTDFGLAKVFDDAGTEEWETWRRGEGESGRKREREKSPSGLLRRLFGRRREGEAPAEPPPTPNAQGLSIGLSQTGTAAGTCTHMAPEQFDDAKHVDVRADIYAFGVMLFQMLTGRLPFVGQTMQELERLHRTQPVPPLTTDNSPFTNIVQTCLAKDPARRFADFGAVRERLAEIYEALAGESAPLPVSDAKLSAAGWSNKGVSLDSLGRSEEALACYDRALAINPRLENAWINKGKALGALGRREEAIACDDLALALNPRLEQAWYNKGVSLKELGRSEEALACYDRALEINPRDAAAWSNKGVALGDGLGRWEEALACYDRALEINPRYEQAWSNKGLALRALGRSEEALACFDRALALNPRNEQAWSNKGLALGALGRSAEALACFDRALALNPRYEKAWYNKGMALGALGRLREALACFEEAQRLGLPQAAQGIALCRQMLGE